MADDYEFDRQDQVIELLTFCFHPQIVDHVNSRPKTEDREAHR
jgi:hypothetical protein